MSQFKKVKLILLPSKNGSKIGVNPSRLSDNKLYYFVHGAVHSEAHHLYVISDDKIKEGDYYQTSDGLFLQIKKAEKKDLEFIKYNRFGKVIATTDKSLGLPLMPNDFIKKYCEVGGFENAMIEYQLYHGSTPVRWVSDSSSLHVHKVLKVENNIINIQPLKHIWNKEEFEKILTEFAMEDAYSLPINRSERLEYVKKWIKEKL